MLKYGFILWLDDCLKPSLNVIVFSLNFMSWGSFESWSSHSIMHKGFDDKHAKNYSISTSSKCPSSDAVHYSLISFIYPHGPLRKTYRSSSFGVYSWILCSSTSSWNEDSPLVTILERGQGFDTILIIEFAHLLNKFLSIFSSSGWSRSRTQKCISARGFYNTIF